MSKKSEQKNAEAKKTVSEEELIPEEVENVPSPEERALAEAAALAEDYKRKWYSVTAEYENYRKRTGRRFKAFPRRRQSRTGAPQLCG